ncbi:CDP-glycerol glycerophosphotransferase family protein [Brevibacterium sp. S111]|uniref:bifunctional glycosyltransferase/CDP-glycerol:glycerophosphate glycerophosphotransferase n=1 Tax=Brevibacterium sp. S111 TaxID=2483795 RepID=UPI001080CA65|nr:CDP-glycerol glycerophosphotransferase family protein [Brevibacterium sp. S111]TGD08487.1 glycosyltransferase [Brevibacterium sp. S111]
MRDKVVRIWKEFAPESTRRTLFHARKRLLAQLKSAQNVVEHGDIQQQEITSMVSIVVPVYRVEQYLEACVNSLLTQSYKNVEIILVDDGSPDRCGEMCDSYAAAHPANIRVHHQPNGGLSNARNNGLKIATGQYVMFVDSDDILPRDALQNLVTALIDHEADIATGNVKRFKGSREWQAWNQMYSHAYSQTWDGESTASVSELITLKQAPELLFDTTAWNKLFNRRFLLESKVRFPEGKLYEDMLPMAQLFIAADGIVKIPSVVYMYREREDNSSITQKRGQLQNLSDKMEMVGKIGEELIRSGATRDQLDTLYFKVLEGDLAVYSPHLGTDTEFDQLYLAELERYWSLSSQQAKLALALDRRALYYSQLYSGNPLDGEREAAWVSTNFHLLPLMMTEGVLLVDASWAPNRLVALGDHQLLDMSRYVNLKQVVTDAYIQGGRLRIEGFAFLDHIPDGYPQELSLSLATPEGSTVELPYKRSVDARANGYWGSGNADRSGDAFVVDISIDELESELTTTCELGMEYELVISVRSGSYEKSSKAIGYWRGGRIRRGELAQTTNGDIVQVPWQPWGKPLHLRVSKPRFMLESIRQNADYVVIRFRNDSDSQVEAVDAVRSWDDYQIRMERVQDLGGNVLEFKTDISRAPQRRKAGGSSNVWRFEVRTEDTTQPEKIMSCAETSRSTDTSDSWTPRTNSVATALWHDKVALLEVNDIQPTERGYVLRGTGILEPGAAFTAEMWSDRGAVHRTTTIHQSGSGRFEIIVECVESGEASLVSWAPGEYRFRLYQSGTSNTEYRIRAGSYLLDSLPQEDFNSKYIGRWHIISDTWELALGISAPLHDFERGRYNDLRMRAHWAQKTDDEVRPIDAVVFSADMGSSAADSQLAILKEMIRRNLQLEYRWAVTDFSVEVPHGAVPLLRGSEEWYKYLSSSRIIINNYGGIAGYGNRRYQRYLQTWHGTPLKHIGNSEFRTNPREYSKRALVAQTEAQEWDWFVSPNPFMSRLIPEELFYDGDIIESGYPRNDDLASASEDTKKVWKSRLGIDPDKKVLLYAPTFRDVSAKGFSSPLVSDLDLETVAQSLGEDWAIVLRGHSFNARNDDKDRSSVSVIDATKHPNINDLILASDLLVTDYSSVMFDYLVTGRPIVYYVPDLEEYLANRGMYHDYEDVLAGEMARNQDELVGLVKLALDPAMVAAHSAAYSRQRARFVPWDDGRAAARVVDRVLMDTERVTD